MSRCPTDFYHLIYQSLQKSHTFISVDLPIKLFTWYMAFDELLAQRIRLSLKLYPTSIASFITEKKMFGGLAFLLKGKMTIGVMKEKLMVRVVSEKMEQALENPHVVPMDFTNKPMKEFIYVTPAGLETEEMLQHWIELGIEHARRKLTL